MRVRCVEWFSTIIRQPAGAVPDVAQIFDTNNFYSGRNVNYATKFSLLDDITHQMVITSYNSSSGVAFSAGPALFKIIR